MLDGDQPEEAPAHRGDQGQDDHQIDAQQHQDQQAAPFGQARHRRRRRHPDRDPGQYAGQGVGAAQQPSANSAADAGAHARSARAKSPPSRFAATPCIHSRSLRRLCFLINSQCCAKASPFGCDAVSTPRSWIFLRRVLRLRPRISAARTWLPRVAASVRRIKGRSTLLQHPVVEARPAARRRAGRRNSRPDGARPGSRGSPGPPGSAGAGFWSCSSRSTIRAVIRSSP